MATYAWPLQARTCTLMGGNPRYRIFDAGVDICCSRHLRLCLDACCIEQDGIGACTTDVNA